MGEGSPKSLRGGGMDDVIFAGTATRPPRDFAEVSLLLEREAGDGGDEEATATASHPRIERGSGSAYRIDGRDVRQMTFLAFADAATGAHSPAWSAKAGSAPSSPQAVERRLMLEEAAGFPACTRGAGRRAELRATEANLTRLNELLGEQESRASALRRQAGRPSVTGS